MNLGLNDSAFLACLEARMEVWMGAARTRTMLNAVM